MIVETNIIAPLHCTRKVNWLLYRDELDQKVPSDLTIPVATAGPPGCFSTGYHHACNR